MRGRAHPHLEVLLRNVAAAMVAMPLLAALVVVSAVRRSAVSRAALVVGLVALVAVGAVALAPRDVSALPPTRVATTGRPQLIASKKTIPNHSSLLANTNISAAA